MTGAPLFVPAAIPPPEPLTHLFFHRVAVSPEHVVAYSKIDGRWIGASWREIMIAVEEIALGLIELGLRRGDAVAIVSNTRIEWTQLDLAILCLGAVTVGIYPTLTGEQTREQLERSRVRFAFVEDRTQRVKIQELGLDLGLITLEPRVDGPVTSLDALRRSGAKRRHDHPDELKRRAADNKSSDPVTHVYTSGTTGQAKGAILTHANFHYVVHATSLLISYDHERTISFLPLAHSMQRYVGYLGLIASSGEAYYAESLEKLPENLLEVRPSAFAVVPRFLEKVHAAAMSAGASGPRARRAVFDRSLLALQRVGAARRRGARETLRHELEAKVADEVLAKRVRAKLGGRVKFLGCGSAPLAKELHEFFDDLGLPVLEGWGLTETSAPVCVNTLAHRRIGTVGRPLPGTQVKIAGDGEILVKGPGVFQGYFGDSAATADAFDDDGWFRTGDVGAMSRDGFLTITDRKKDLIITAGGKNVAPQPIEAHLKREPLVGEAVLIGDRRPYLTVLIGLDPATAPGGAPLDPVALAAIPEVRARIDRILGEVNAHLPRFEQIKRWGVLPHRLSVENGELTPTMKVKRGVVQERFAEEIQGLYEDPA